jgi:hypothetical protein
MTTGTGIIIAELREHYRKSLLPLLAHRRLHPSMLAMVPLDV